MESRTHKPNPITDQSVPLDSFVEDMPELPAEEGVDVAGEVKFGKGAQAWWLRAWIFFLVVWALWYAFVGGKGLFHHLEEPINLFFIGVVIAWAIYHYVLAPRFKWPHLPLG